ncbi:phage holin, lambda family [Chromohalobacter nigrandesensis]|uniref:phage holin, lambda family n=1 Tax=Chromohalobacter nigrandesensis TaxID=119863 RepID=UPI001FF3C523|nr:phage holin, lambda family [Chromohalobacter nigrandesensis]MCK0745982.1 phage holin, lambda family [Chromohalobacter nigrandesensis]
MDISSAIVVVKDFFKGDSLLAGIMISVVISALRVIAKGGGKLEALIEATLCGCLTFVSYSLMNHLGVSEGLTVTVGGVIGFMGVKKIRFFVDKAINSKVS